MCVCLRAYYFTVTHTVGLSVVSHTCSLCTDDAYMNPNVPPGPYVLNPQRLIRHESANHDSRQIHASKVSEGPGLRGGIRNQPMAACLRMRKTVSYVLLTRCRLLCSDMAVLFLCLCRNVCLTISLCVYVNTVCLLTCTLYLPISNKQSGHLVHCQWQELYQCVSVSLHMWIKCLVPEASWTSENTRLWVSRLNDLIGLSDFISHSLF